MKKLTLLLAIALSAAVAFSAPTIVTAEENTAIKADDAKKNKPDREITRQIRRAVVKDKSLSVKAHNVKIDTKDGQVTLKGPVKTEEEKAAIEKAAARVAGKGKVTNELEVAPPKEK